MWRTDGQTQRRTPHDGTGRACIPSRGKNQQLSARAGHICLHTTTWFSPDVFRLILQAITGQMVSVGVDEKLPCRLSRFVVVTQYTVNESNTSYVLSSYCGLAVTFVTLVTLILFWLIDWLLTSFLQPTNTTSHSSRLFFCSRKHFYIQSVNL